jgi:hypothetical protein
VTEVVIGTTGDAGSDDAAALGIALTRTLGATPVVAHVRPEAWQVVGAGRVDAEWDRYLEDSSRDIVARPSLATPPTSNPSARGPTSAGTARAAPVWRSSRCAAAPTGS